jgi:NAD(P)-dependent dehydrogenase (short-subunit alcohol dehydrogenase family)
MPGRVEDKVCVVTGAAAGIGLAVARRLHAEGGRIVLADIDASGVREAAAELPGSEAFTADVTDSASVEALYAFARERFGSVDVCHNNAGVLLAEDTDPPATDLDVWHRIISVDLTGVFVCLKHQIPHMLETGGGSIVNMSSMVALMGSATPQTAYAAAKGGVLAMTREVAVTYARSGIRCNALCPGPVDTPLFRNALAADEGGLERRMVHIPMGRLGTFDDMANAVLHLASDESAWTTGQAFVVDGGITVAYTTP